MPEALDQSWGFADPKAAKAAGVQVVSMYLSRDASKNMTASDVKAYHKAGIAMLFNWENEAGAPLKGAAQGKADAEQAVKLAKQIIAAVGYRPKNRLVIYFSCDTNVSSSQFPAIDAYYKAAKTVCNAAGFGIGCYGEADLVSHLSSAGITDAEWQTYAWSGGKLSPAADFYQYQNGQKLGGAEVDFDRVIHPTELGAWWPPGSPYDGDEVLDPNDPTVKKINALYDALTGADGHHHFIETLVREAITQVKFPKGAFWNGSEPGLLEVLSVLHHWISDLKDKLEKSSPATVSVQPAEIPAVLKIGSSQ